jgi:hypothetical protein
MKPATPTERLLCVIGSGDTAPTMVAIHTELMRRVGSPPGLAVALDTPYGFQENADEVSAKVRTYFRTRVRHPIETASLRDVEREPPVALGRLYHQLREARYVFAGPGSPSYALRHWRRAQVPELLAAHLAEGGCVSFASAAAITLGRFALPVYEIYKVGEPVRWLEGLNLLGPLGLDVAVIPHYDNTEGGTHDTRFCYMGERRLRELERSLPEEVMIFGVAEHTAAIFDLNAGTLEVRGRGFVAVRRAGRERRFAPGEPIRLDQLGRDAAASAHPVAFALPANRSEAGRGHASPLLDEAERHRRAFERALERSSSDDAVGAILGLEDELVGWRTDSLESDAMERARSVYREMLVRLADALPKHREKPSRVLGRLVDLALRLRDDARRNRRYADADLIRSTLEDVGIEVHDSPSGTHWSWRRVAESDAAPIDVGAGFGAPPRD